MTIHDVHSRSGLLAYAMNLTPLATKGSDYCPRSSYLTLSFQPCDKRGVNSSGNPTLLNLLNLVTPYLLRGPALLHLKKDQSPSCDGVTTSTCFPSPSGRGSG